MSQNNKNGNGASNSGSSGVSIPPRSRMRETSTVSPDRFFEYLGYHFTPVGISEYSTALPSDHQYTLIEWSSPPLYGVHDSLYSQKSFCETAKTSYPGVDVYYCRETAKFYIPGVRNLFEYRGRVHRFLREEDLEMHQEQKQAGKQKKREKAPALRLKF